MMEIKAKGFVLNRDGINKPGMSIPHSDRGESLFVWSVWLVMILVAIVCLVTYSRNVPITEDWLLVPPLTGNEPNLADWLWAQNNEHRIPIPRLILLALLKVTHGDFRVGMYLNIIMLGGLAFAMIRVARSLRGGRTRFADAFFPITLLHLGNWENLFWGWQFTFVSAPVLSTVILLILVGPQALAAPNGAAIAGICLMLLPLCGANGIVFVPLLALWLGYHGILDWRSMQTKCWRRWTGGFLIGAAVVALCLTGLYFVGYERPAWTPPNPGVWPSLHAALQFLSLSFGPVARSHWDLSIIAAIGVFLPSAVVLVLGVLRHKGLERHRAIGVLVFFGSLAVFVMAMGWGRAGVIPIYGSWPIRYVLLAVPALCTAFFIWELYGPAKLRTLIQSSFFLGMCLLTPFNTIHGFWWNDWYQQGVESLERDIAAGTPNSILAKHHRSFLFHSMESAKLADLMWMLHEAGIGSFARIQKDPVVTQEIHYHMPDAGEVVLVWGINGWRVVPEEIRPAGTDLKNKVMHTPMVQKGGIFVAQMQVPTGTTIDYGFLITNKRDGTAIRAIWDGNGTKDFHTVVTQNGVVEVKTTLTLNPDQPSTSPLRP